MASKIKRIRFSMLAGLLIGAGAAFAGIEHPLLGTPLAAALLIFGGAGLGVAVGARRDAAALRAAFPPRAAAPLIAAGICALLGALSDAPGYAVTAVCAAAAAAGYAFAVYRSK